MTMRATVFFKESLAGLVNTAKFYQKYRNNLVLFSFKLLFFFTVLYNSSHSEYMENSLKKDSHKAYGVNSLEHLN